MLNPSFPPLTRSALGLIRLYQRYLSPHKGFSCAHRVLHGGLSCSEYARQSIAHHGLSTGLPLARQRLRDCHHANGVLRERRSGGRGLQAGMKGLPDRSGLGDRGDPIAGKPGADPTNLRLTDTPPTDTLPTSPLAANLRLTDTRPTNLLPTNSHSPANSEADDFAQPSSDEADRPSEEPQTRPSQPQSELEQYCCDPLSGCFYYNDSCSTYPLPHTCHPHNSGPHHSCGWPDGSDCNLDGGNCGDCGGANLDGCGDGGCDLDFSSCGN